MNSEFRHIGIAVKNIEDSLFFYKKYFGFKIEKDLIEGGEYLQKFLKIKNIKARTIKLINKNSNVRLELLKFEKVNQNTHDIQISDFGLTHFSLTIDDIDNFYSTFIKNNIFCLSEPIISVDKKTKAMFCKDPNGVLIELVEVL
tara:strand:+ start:197 stop:628 length:432 start_codon:yes stop_codon:yes gene_type:complete